MEDAAATMAEHLRPRWRLLMQRHFLFHGCLQETSF